MPTWMDAAAYIGRRFLDAFCGSNNAVQLKIKAFQQYRCLLARSTECLAGHRNVCPDGSKVWL
jgi:hypothetical protein